MIDDGPKLPSNVSPEIGLFDRFASWVSNITSKAWFFLFCVGIVVLWGPSILVIKDVNMWQLWINTTTTIFTFILVSLLQNTQTRDTNALHRKINAIADGLADHMQETGDVVDSERKRRIAKDVQELKAAVGIEDKESS